MKNNPNNVRFELIESVLKTYGFNLVRVKGSHHIFSDEINTITIPYHRPVKAFYVKLVLKTIGV